jgi:hypothetical protein
MSENDTDAGETCEPEARRLVRTAPVKLRPSLSRVSQGTESSAGCAMLRPEDVVMIRIDRWMMVKEW